MLGRSAGTCNWSMHNVIILTVECRITFLYFCSLSCPLISAAPWCYLHTSVHALTAGNLSTKVQSRVLYLFLPILYFILSFAQVLFIFSLVFCSPDLFDGYLCFVVSIIGIGCLTAVIGDVASHFGCTVGLKDAVTAVAFVALGTSVPGKATGPSTQLWQQPFPAIPIAATSVWDYSNAPLFDYSILMKSNIESGFPFGT